MSRSVPDPSLRGPEITGVGPADTMPAPAEYAAWRRSRRRQVPPEDGPVVSVVAYLSEPGAELLTETVRSVRRQTYPRWELVLVDASTAPHVPPICERFRQLDARVRVVRCPPGSRAAGTNAGVSVSAGAWLVFLDGEDSLDDAALAAVAGRAGEAPDADVVYWDDDRIGDDGEPEAPFFKPDWSPDLLRCVDYLGTSLAVRRELFDRAGRFRDGFEGAEGYDFSLRATREARSVQHVADVLSHRRHGARSTMCGGDRDAGRRALADFLSREVPGSSVEAVRPSGVLRARYPARREVVSIVVPFRDSASLTERLLVSLGRFGTDLPFEVLLVSNRSEALETFDAADRWIRRWPWARLVTFDEPFNFQRLNNWAVEQVSGRYLLFLNNDTEALHDRWIDALAEHAQRPPVGAVGARLFYPDGLVQHAGVAVGIGGFADHPWSRLRPDAVTPAGPSYWVRDVTAVTAACLMVAREKFEKVGGFDERFEVCGGDVDLCIRLVDAGYRNVVTPFARLVHHEAATRDWQPPANDVRESLRSYAAYLEHGDPYYNPNLTLADTTCRLEVRGPREPSDRRVPGGS